MGELPKQQELFRVQSFRWMVFIVSVFCVNAPPSALARFEPPCLGDDFTWTTHSGKTQECKFLKVEAVTSRGGEYCSNPLQPLSVENESQHPPAAKNVQASYFTAQYVSEEPANDRFDGSIWSGLNITFQLGLEAAGKVTGVLLSMISVSPDSSVSVSDKSYDKLYCRVYNFVHPLSMDALLDQQGKPLQLYFDCYRGQKPGMEYEYTVRTLPVLDTSGTDPNDTAVTFRYRFPSCFTIPDDYLCRESVTNRRPPQIALCSYWKPQYFIVTANYSALTIFMELGPEECGFDSFRFAAHTPTSDLGSIVPWDNGFTQVDVANTSHFEIFAYGRNITYIKVGLKDVSAGRRVVMVAPWPSQNTCFRNDGTDKPCRVTQSAVLTVIENPCLSGPCSSFEDCKPNGEDFICQCKAGYIRDHPLCIENPCEVLTDVNGTLTTYNPCGSGSCTISSNKRSYTCSCHEELAFVDGTCRVHPCVSNPCGHHGSCKHSDQSRQSSVTSVPFSCNCEFGYHYDNANQSCQVSVGTLVAVILTSLFSAALLLLLLLAWRRKRSPRNLLLKAMPCLRNDGSPNECFVDQSSSRTPIMDSAQSPGVYQQVPERTEIIKPLKRVKTVLFSSEDHPLHDETVQQLAVFLQENCMCDVILPKRCTRDIARRGVNEWITSILDWADKIILLCSKGSTEAWRAHSSISPAPADIFTRAVSFLLKDNTSVGLPDNCCVAYLDYSSKSDIPPPLAVGAVYRLMKHMDALFFRLHDMKQGAPEWKLRASDLEEDNYAKVSPEGAGLYRAIQQMGEFQAAEPDWYERFHSVPSYKGVESQTDLGDDSEVDETEYNSALQQFLSTTVV
ncbi:uncharacterized protein LOC119732175 [Patiria miniata]|uniref:SEFIR domain-containing protein n=1 Tax=Patiria miniata TaxID=46514 RepID=A0A914ACR0_PATMI|nr:uncharacterized protein LOC119732175 [Patiria miniata]